MQDTADSPRTHSSGSKQALSQGSSQQRGFRNKNSHTVILQSYMVAMVEPLDANLLKDLRGLGKLATFDGNGAEYQAFRFSTRI